jgi:tetratricopeptide (TPR) repeat protein
MEKNVLGIFLGNILMGLLLTGLALSDFITKPESSLDAIRVLDIIMILFGSFLIMSGIYQIRRFSAKIYLFITIALILAGALLLNIFWLFTILIIALIMFLVISFIIAFREMNKFNKVIKLAGDGQYNESLDYFDKYLKSNPNDPIAWISKALTLQNFGIGEYEEALKCCNNALNLKLNKKTWILRRYLKSRMFFIKGVILFNLKEYDKAVEYADKSLKINKKMYRSWNLKGCALYELGNYEESIKYYDIVISNPKSKIKSIALSNKTEALIKLEKYPEALEYINQALKIDSKAPEIWINKGLTLERLGHYKEAMESYNKNLDLYSTIKPWQLQRALETFDRYLDKNPEEAAIWFNKGIILKNLDKNQEALICYSTALELDPNFEPALKAREHLLSSSILVVKEDGFH